MNAETAPRIPGFEAALGGDGRAFAALVSPHLPMLYRVAARACSDPSLAEDAVQDALALAWRRLGDVRSGASLKAFLAGIAVQRAHTLLRSENRRRHRERRSTPAAPASTPEELIGAADTERRIRDALAAMPTKRRTAALLRLDAGLDYAAIAEAMGGKAGAARALVHLAMNDLREALGLAERGTRDER